MLHSDNQGLEHNHDHDNDALSSFSVDKFDQDQSGKDLLRPAIMSKPQRFFLLPPTPENISLKIFNVLPYLVLILLSFLPKLLVKVMGPKSKMPNRIINSRSD